jgi:hypothetical protein
MSEKYDDLEAVRRITEILSNFSENEIERIIRWSLEKIGITTKPSKKPDSNSNNASDDSQLSNPKKSIKEFYNEKKPGNDVRFAVMVAYYYKFEAPETEKKDEINSEILQEATRYVNRERLKKPIDTLNNSAKQGYINKGSNRGYYVINTVGENLVAMTMPEKD